MARYYSHTVILPDETHLDDFVVEVTGHVSAYYPFTGEIHSTIYLDRNLKSLTDNLSLERAYSLVSILNEFLTAEACKYRH